MCPKPERSPSVAFPIPEELKKMICSVATSEVVEEAAVDRVCEFIKTEFPSLKIEPDCKTVATLLWDEVKATCPKPNSTVVAFPTPEEIKHMLCEAVTSETLEKEGSEELCKYISQQFPSVPETMCVEIVEDLWDQAKAMCPKPERSPSVAFPIPEELKKMICSVATSEVVEEAAVDRVCEFIKTEFPSLKIEPDCKTVATLLWDEVKATCPKPNSTVVAFPTPQEIEKLVCKEIRSAEFGPVAAKRVCRVVRMLTTAVPQCQRLVMAMWLEAKALCGKGVSQAELVAEFKAFKTRFGRVYATADEEASRLANFRDALTRVRDHNAQPGVSFKKALNQFSDMSDAEFEQKVLMAPQHCSATHRASVPPGAPQRRGPARAGRLARKGRRLGGEEPGPLRKLLDLLDHGVLGGPCRDQVRRVARPAAFRAAARGLRAGVRQPRLQWRLAFARL